jgi:alpha-glucosidase
MDYPADNNVSQTIDSWMFGENMLVSPVVTNYAATTKSVYLPAGSWINYWTDAVYAGGAATTIPVNVDTIPVLVKQGAIIPTQGIVQYINNYPVTQNTNNAIVPVSFHVYGGASSTYEYIDDDGVTYNYEKGAFRSILYTHTSSATDEQITIGAKQGSYAPAADSNGYFVFHGISWTPVSVSVQSGSITASKVAVTALSSTAAPAWAYDDVRKQALVKVATPFAAGTVRIASNTAVKKAPSSVSLKSTRITLYQGRLLIPISYTGSNYLTVRLITGAGVVAKEFRFSSLPQGEQTLSLSTEKLAQGVCFAQLSSGTCSVLKKIIVVR